VAGFLFVIIEHFSLAVTVQSKSAFSKKGGGSLQEQGGRGHSTPLCWCQKTRVITLSCGIKVSALCSFLSSQSTRLMDRETDRRTE